MNPARWLCCATLLLLSASATWAQDRADLDRTQIIGNRELPKVLYIVPWKKPLPGTLAGRPVHSVLDEALAPVDREVFRRTLRFDAQERARTGTSTGAPPLPAEPPPATPSSRTDTPGATR